MRLFLAIRLSEEIKASHIHAQNALYDAGIRGNYSPPENLHITLAFIGEYPEARDVMDALCPVRFTPFSVTLRGLGAFGETWWAGIEPQPALEAVARRIRRALAAQEIPFDRKRFSPHITLVRRAGAGPVPPVELQSASMTVEEICLMRSDRGKGRMIYTQLAALEADPPSACDIIEEEAAP